MRIQKLSANQCSECKTPFQRFADRHVMERETVKSLDICGMCAERLYNNGWRLVASFYGYIYK